MTVSMDVVAAGTDQPGECPVWWPDAARLPRVDISAQASVVRDLASGAERRRTLDAPVGFALPTAGGGRVAGTGRRLVHLPTFDAEPVTLAAVEPERSANRFNDAACDARGRLWAGTMSTTREPGAANLYCLLPS